jgi:hypothetical protein
MNNLILFLVLIFSAELFAKDISAFECSGKSDTSEIFFGLDNETVPGIKVVLKIGKKSVSLIGFDGVVENGVTTFNLEGDNFLTYRPSDGVITLQFYRLSKELKQLKIQQDQEIQMRGTCKEWQFSIDEEAWNKRGQKFFIAILKTNSKYGIY